MLAILPEDVESNKAVCEGLHDFFVHSQLPATVDEGKGHGTHRHTSCYGCIIIMYINVKSREGLVHTDISCHGCIAIA